jgi:hypothetical protein
MRSLFRKHRARLLALLLALFLITVVCTACVYCVLNVHHHCTGENCPICSNMQSLLALASGFSITFPCVLVTALFFIAARAAAFHLRAMLPARTPVRLCDRLNN